MEGGIGCCCVTKEGGSEVEGVGSRKGEKVPKPRVNK